MSGPASGIPAKGATKHGPDCSCTRCLAFQPGNSLSLRHGAYASPVRLSDEVSELAADLVPLVPAYRESDGPLVSLLALALRRITRAEPVIAAAEEQGDGDAATRLREEQRRWAGSAARMLESLGMSPTARAKLGLDVAMTQRALTVAELHAQAGTEGDAEEAAGP
jgi:hypothetical protein